MSTAGASSGPLPTSGPRRRRGLRVVGLVLAVIVGLPVAVYLGHGVVGSVSTARLRTQVAAEVRAGRAEAQPRVLALRERQRRAGITPRHSWAALRCSFDTSDAGWIVQSYQQSCEVATLDFVAVGSVAEAEQVSADLPADLFGSPADRDPDRSRCRPLRIGRTADGVDVQVLWVPAATVPAGDDHCYAIDTRALSGAQEEFEPFDSATLAPGAGWLVVGSSTAVLERRNLGCSPWSILFCSAPFSEPALG